MSSSETDDNIVDWCQLFLSSVYLFMDEVLSVSSSFSMISTLAHLSLSSSLVSILSVLCSVPSESLTHGKTLFEMTPSSG